MKFETIAIQHDYREKWKNNFYGVNSFHHIDFLDSDGDGVPNSKDCEPYNPKKQDTPQQQAMRRAEQARAQVQSRAVERVPATVPSGKVVKVPEQAKSGIERARERIPTTPPPKKTPEQPPSKPTTPPPKTAVKPRISTTYRRPLVPTQKKLSQPTKYGVIATGQRKGQWTVRNPAIEQVIAPGVIRNKRTGEVIRIVYT